MPFSPMCSVIIGGSTSPLSMVCTAYTGILFVVFNEKHLYKHKY